MYIGNDGFEVTTLPPSVNVSKTDFIDIERLGDTAYVEFSASKPFKFTAAPVSIEGGLGGQGWPVDDTSNAPPTTYSDDSDLSSGGYSGT